jgi:hypothetical protein
LTTILRIFDMAGRMETWRYEAGSAADFRLPLKTGMTTPVLKSAGTTPEGSYMLITWAMGDTRISMPFLRMETGMPSTPKASMGCNAAMVLATLPALAKEKWKGEYFSSQSYTGGEMLSRPACSLYIFSM